MSLTKGLGKYAGDQFREWKPRAMSWGEEIIKAAMVRTGIMLVCALITFIASFFGYNGYLTWRTMIALIIVTVLDIQAIRTFIAGSVLGCLAYIAMFRTMGSLWAQVTSFFSSPTGATATSNTSWFWSLFH